MDFSYHPDIICVSAIQIGMEVLISFLYFILSPDDCFGSVVTRGSEIRVNSLGHHVTSERKATVQGASSDNP